MTLDEAMQQATRGTIDIISREELAAKLSAGRKLNVKFGIDPTAPDIHLGHTVPLHKLRQFQEQGHNIQLIIGDYTAMIGDPSGRSETRPMLTREQIEANLKTYTTQVFKILDRDATNVYFNSSWLGKFSGEDMIKLASKYSVQQLLQRRDFSNRMEQRKPLSISELFYPLLVGYDSVHLQTDIELGGSDQLFNFMTSRDLQSVYGQQPEVIMILPLLEGVDGKKKMSKSLGNAIGVTDEPSQMYGKIMSITDVLMIKYYELLSTVPVGQLERIKANAQSNEFNPMDLKKNLASEIVSRYHGAAAASQAQDAFEARFQRKDASGAPLELQYDSANPLKAVDLVSRVYGTSKNEARRLLEQKAVRVNDAVVDAGYVLGNDAFKLQVGKRQLYHVTLKPQ